jgi:hypothetical protein
MTNKIRFELKPFQAGQVWEVGETSLRISLVGKMLIQYQRYKGKSRAAPTAFATKRELEAYLTKNKAVLVQH